MRTDDFNYELPPALIAQEPLVQRDLCRLLLMKRGSMGTDAFQHLQFRDILKIFKKGDRLVFNDTRVIPARVFCRKHTGAALEFFFTERISDTRWKALIKPAKRAGVGTEVYAENFAHIKLMVEEVSPDGYERVVKLICGADTLEHVIETCGHIPLPHYIRRSGGEIDRELYQTVYAGVLGAVAAPTAGLHFTNALLDELSAAGVDRSFVTLHVGAGTFRPVQVDDPSKHDIHEERFELSERAAGEINSTWENGGRVIAVGTTVVRVLESCAELKHKVIPKSSRTKLMILPPYQFKAADGLVTNFHLPRSTLLMLVSAFAERERVLCAYKEAVEKRYRFYSYGDAMVIV
ncbi:MAG: tRNA preQ1(34) S-adenosylmethionine ribosyltransferase-isomerase QueA [Chitinispirillales bacterium]|nr:tRNA preQ1(34) S-adenosylmethionine ribosyltransferase-isomerase QueA [Chitinispirillales bacterium]